MKIYYGDFLLVFGVGLLAYVMYKLFRRPQSTIDFYGPELFNVSQNVDMSRRNAYGAILEILYMIPFIMWFILSMFVMDFDLTEMNEHMLMFTVITLIVTLVVKLQVIYVGLDWWYDFTTFFVIGLYYIILGLRESTIHWLGLGEVFGLPESTGVVNPEVFLIMALSLTLVFSASLAILFHHFMSLQNRAT